MGTTPNYQLPYPETSDPATVPVDVRELADRLEVRARAVAAAAPPVGSPIPWLVTAIPAGYREFDGSAIVQATHPKLYALFGATMPDSRAHAARRERHLCGRLSRRRSVARPGYRRNAVARSSKRVRRKPAAGVCARQQRAGAARLRQLGRHDEPAGAAAGTTCRPTTRFVGSPSPVSIAGMQPPAVEVSTDVGDLWAPADDEFTRSVGEHGYWEQHVARLLNARLRTGSTLLDVGAHVGYFTVLASKLVGPTGRVVAVEPEPDVIEFLRANVERHALGNVTVLPLAAWDELGLRRLSVNPANRGGSTLDAGDTGDVDVVVAPLDTVLAGERFDVVKVDAEGSDHIAIRGAERLVTTADVAVVEFWPRRTLHDWLPSTILAYYASLGRELGLVTVAGDVEPKTADALLALDVDYVELALTAAPAEALDKRAHAGARRPRLGGGQRCG